VYFANLVHTFERFLTFDVLVQAIPALRDRRKIFSTNNLRLVKFFLEIIREDLIAKIYKSRNNAFCPIFGVFVSNSRHILGVFGFCIFVQARPALRDLRYFFSTNNLRLVKNFLEIIKEDLIAKIYKP